MATTADLDGGLELQKIGLADKDLLGGNAQLPDLRIGQLRILNSPPALGLQKSPYDIVQQNQIHRHQLLLLSKTLAVWDGTGAAGNSTRGPSARTGNGEKGNPTEFLKGQRGME